MAVSEFRGKKAITNYKTLKVLFQKGCTKISLVECELETEEHTRLGSPELQGHVTWRDEKYGKKKLGFKKINKEFKSYLNKIDGQALHAKTLEFTHPSTKKELVLIVKFLKNLKKC